MPPDRSDALVLFGATGDLAYKQIFPALLGLVRIAQGGHFLSDVVASGLLVFAVSWALYRLIIAWNGLGVCTGLGARVALAELLTNTTGRPAKSDGSRIDAITTSTCRFRCRASWTAADDLPVPGEPHSNTGIPAASATAIASSVGFRPLPPPAARAPPGSVCS